MTIKYKHKKTKLNDTNDDKSRLQKNNEFQIYTKKYKNKCEEH